MYHVIANLELIFNSLQDAIKYAESRPVFHPKIPATAMRNEDMTTPRICGAGTIEQCVTAIGVIGTFRRCLNGNPDTKSYENDHEAYPILVAYFDDRLDWHSPDKKQVPDINDTGEKWLLEPARPDKIELRWLDAYSINIQSNAERTVCTKIRFLDTLAKCHHPWLDKQGHPLDCSAMGGDPWPDMSQITQSLYLDARLGGHLGFAAPSIALDGSYVFTPLTPNIAPYRTYPNTLKQFTGYYDRNYEPVFGGYVLKFESRQETRKFGTVEYEPRTGWRIKLWDNAHIIKFPENTNVLHFARIHIGHGLNKTIRIPEKFQQPDRKTQARKVSNVPLQSDP